MLKEELRCKFTRNNKTRKKGFVRYQKVKAKCANDPERPGEIEFYVCKKCKLSGSFIKTENIKNYRFQAKPFIYEMAIFNKTQKRFLVELPVGCYCKWTKKKKKFNDKK